MSEQEEEEAAAAPKKKLLPFEMIEEIFRRVQAKSLLRFRCVSKSFLQLTRTPQFIKLHFNKSQETTNYMVLKDCYWNTYLIDCSSCDQITKLNPPFKNSIQCLSSCNGLLCVEDVNGYVYLWNPFTKKHMTILGGRASEDSRLSYGLGFGYNSVSNDYEIVKLVSSNVDRGMSRLLVYSVRRRACLVTVMVPYKVCYMREGLFFNGAIHWISNSQSKILIAYDLGGRMFREMKLPGCENVKWINVSVLDGCICVLYDFASHVEVWEMKEYGVEESWVMLFADALLGNYIGVTMKGEFLLQENGGGLCLYDPRGKSLRDLVNDDSTQYLSLGTTLVGSLMPLPSREHRVPERNRDRNKRKR